MTARRSILYFPMHADVCNDVVPRGLDSFFSFFFLMSKVLWLVRSTLCCFLFGFRLVKVEGKLLVKEGR